MQNQTQKKQFFTVYDKTTFQVIIKGVGASTAKELAARLNAGTMLEKATQ